MAIRAGEVTRTEDRYEHGQEMQLLDQKFVELPTSSQDPEFQRFGKLFTAQDHGPLAPKLRKFSFKTCSMCSATPSHYETTLSSLRI